ncbi:hypothetical protein CAPTEDRAFT_214941 [Capitella teleta]|uniref:Lipoamide acyltransferase component of branched-chain alpha-keto acid dehydrogenase complex, mitochondrial n=1 Tax=Capitella teleta TaxID=283909 RepID=R7TMB5_CAPTE|nr:hypothetical protein CAPTEDRAFT_214941 [Capitella teleta]|eukprot:ELT92225.1 hypothetical protein CAPTEDRAFT_214941 [Capitella teleta]
MLNPEAETRVSWVEKQLEGRKGPVVAASDYMSLYANQIREFVPGTFISLGTDGFGRSDTREQLRRFFEVDRYFIVVAALYALVPDIGSGEAEVIEICVKPGDTVSAEDSLIVLESDKATMEVPAPRDGVVTEVLLNVGDNVGEGAPMIKMAAAGEKPAAAHQAEAAVQPAAPAPVAAAAPAGGTHIESVRVPDIGADNVPVIEVCVKVGDTVALEDSLIVLESDKATMEVPSPVEGVVKAIHVKEGDALNQGDLVIDVEVNGGGAVAEVPAPAAPEPAEVAPAAPVAQAGPRIEKVTVPDIGAENVPVIEVCVSIGDQIEEEASLIVLESDKATMEVPSPFTGVVKAITVKEESRNTFSCPVSATATS